MKSTASVTSQGGFPSFNVEYSCRQRRVKDQDLPEGRTGRTSPHLREALHGPDQEDHVLNQVRHPHPELSEVVGVLGDPLLDQQQSVSSSNHSSRFCVDPVSYMIWIQLTVSGQAVQEPLDVRSEERVKSHVVDLIQVFAEAVPEVKGDLHDLEHTTHISPGPEPQSTHRSWTSGTRTAQKLR